MTAPTETQNNKELENPVALEPAEKPSSSQPQLQPQPPSSPAHGQSRRSGGKAERGVKRGLKNKSAAADSVVVKGAGDSSGAAAKPVTRVEEQLQQPQEPNGKCTIVRMTKTASPADRECTVASENAPHAHPSAGRSPQLQRREGDNRSERRGDDQEQKHGAVAAAAASHSNKTQVRFQCMDVFPNRPHGSLLAARPKYLLLNDEGARVLSHFCSVQTQNPKSEFLVRMLDEL